MKKLRLCEFLIVSLTGAFLYALIEVLFRGYTHPSMAVAGGICFTALYFINLKMKSRSLILRGVIGSVVITAVEFGFGVIFNIWLGLGVWDYSNQPLNIFGQICPVFSFIWFIISIPVVYISVFIFHRLNKKLFLIQE